MADRLDNSGSTTRPECPSCGNRGAVWNDQHSMATCTACGVEVLRCEWMRGSFDAWRPEANDRKAGDRTHAEQAEYGEGYRAGFQAGTVSGFRGGERAAQERANHAQ